MSEGALSPVQETFRALATGIVPESAKLDVPGWERLEKLVEQALSARPESLRRQLRLFIRVLNLLPVLRFGRTFRRLEAGNRAVFLHGIENAPLLALRRAFWGVRTLVFLGYYGSREAGESIGYRADPRGWEVRR